MYRLHLKSTHVKQYIFNTTYKISPKASSVIKTDKNMICSLIDEWCVSATAWQGEEKKKHYVM